MIAIPMALRSIRRNEIRSAGILLVAVAICFHSAAARGSDYTIEGQTIRFEAPNGYCLVAPEHGAGAEAWLRASDGELAATIGFFMECSEWRRSIVHPDQPPVHGGAVALAKKDGTIYVNLNETRYDVINRNAKKYGSIDPAAADEALRKRLRKADVIPELKEARLVGQDDLAAYIAIERVLDPNFEPEVSVQAISKTNGLIFSTVRSAPASDPNVIETLLDAQRQYVQYLVNLNETPEEQRRQSMASATILEKLGRILGRYSDVEMGAACLLVAMLMFLRLRRS